MSENLEAHTGNRIPHTEKASLFGCRCAVAGLRYAPLLLLTACGAKTSVTRPMPRGVIVNASTQHYPVTGGTIPEIGLSLRRAAEAAQGFVGHYSARWRYSYGFSEARGAGCTAVNVRFDLQSIIRVPQWERPPAADSAVVAAWDRYIAALDDHEREHERIAILAVGDLVREIERLREPSCNQLRIEIERTARDSDERARVRQARLDEETGHGASGGAQWPPVTADR